MHSVCLHLFKLIVDNQCSDEHNILVLEYFFFFNLLEVYGYQ